MYLGTGGKILFWAADSSEVHLQIGLNVWTRNYVGTIFGGSFFSASDPFYMVMLMRILGPAFVVWDKSAHIRFRKPGKSKVFTVLKITQEDLSGIKSRVKESGHTTIIFTIKWWDKNQMVYAEIERQCYIADKGYYEKRKGESQSARF